MEGEGGVKVVRSESEAPVDHHETPVTENAARPTPAAAEREAGGVAPVTVAPVLKKKRGRPIKYRPDGPAMMVAAPSPVIDFSGQRQAAVGPAAGGGIMQQRPNFEVENIGDWVSRPVSTNFTPYLITVNAGEDIMMKVISFSQQGPQAICVLSANGAISSVTLRHPDSSGGTLTYQGRFEILSLTGSFVPSESGGIKNRSGGLSVSLASTDGRVVGGGVAGLLVAASPIQIVVGSFLAGDQRGTKA